MIVFSLWPRKLGFPFFYRNVFHPLFFSTFVPTTTLAPSAVSPIKATLQPEVAIYERSITGIKRVGTTLALCGSKTNHQQSPMLSTPNDSSSYRHPTTHHPITQVKMSNDVEPRIHDTSSVDTSMKGRLHDKRTAQRVSSRHASSRRTRTFSEGDVGLSSLQRKKRLCELVEKREQSTSSAAKKTATQQPPQQEQQQTLGRRWPNPNKTDKAGRTKLFGCTAAGDLVKVKELIACGAQVNHRDNAGWTPLHEAALKGQLEVAQYLIECGAQVNVRGFGNDTPLHDASAAGFADCVRLLVDAGADVFALNANKETPLDVCDDKKCASLLRTKMQQLEQLVPQDKDGRTELHKACAEGDYDHVVSLLKRGANVNARDNMSWTPLHETACQGSTAIARLLIQHGADVNFPGYRGSTALHRASATGYTELVQFLLESGANVELQDDRGNCPYDVAVDHAMTRHYLALRMDELRKERAASDAIDEITFQSHKKQRRHGPDADNDKGTSEQSRPLSREERKIQAIMRTFATMEQKKRPRKSSVADNNDDDHELSFEEYSKNLRRKRRVRTQSLSSTSRESSVSLDPQQVVPASTTTQQKPGADPRKLNPTKKDASGRTFLHKRSGRGDIPAVEALLEAGANPNEQDNAGYTPLHEAALRGRTQAVLILLQHGADANAKGADDDTALHDATANGHTDVIHHLLQFGANPHATNAKGITPIDIAADSGNSDIEKLLRQAPALSQGKKQQTSSINNESTKQRPNNETKMTQQPKAQARSVSGRHLPKKNLRLSQMSDIAATTPTNSKGPIPTPPPERRFNFGNDDDHGNTHDIKPLFTVKHWDETTSKMIPCVVDLQVSMLFGMKSTADFWKQYPDLTHQPIHVDQKSRLWPTFSSMLCNQPHHDAFEAKRNFIESDLYLVPLDQVFTIVKQDYSHMTQHLTTQPVDTTHDQDTSKGLQQETAPSATLLNIVSRRPGCSLPPKFALKLQKLKK
ncbi:nacht and ankyrin domain protein [Lichtheimia corymbifera JMRC:FSU:9682]|uniref:Nacht and ankyrin domain protein n=1 Tax=Lichtheimia corymbifera JMRC:FSU:9682 TaxID=1263082 RepID=A0A068RG93_9FUNG|nr:nacht and ankyrin domain protein [Lichtheimia corymbifera JMRC:FSU:9682]